MRVTVCFGQTRVIVPCKGGATVAELVKEACNRYKKAIGKSPKYWVKIRQLENAVDGGILDVDDYVYDVAEDRDQLIAIFEEEDDEIYSYNGWDHRSGPGSDGHRSPMSSFQLHQGLHGRFSGDHSPANRGRGKAPTGNATVIKHDNQDPNLEVNVGVEALKSGSGSNITVLDPVSSGLKDEGRTKHAVKKTPGLPHYYGRKESDSRQEEDFHLADQDTKQREIMITTANSSPEQNVSVVTASSDTNNSIDSGHHSIKTKYPSESMKSSSSFIRGSTRQSIMGMLSENHEDERGCKSPSHLDSYSGSYSKERHLPPPPKDATIYPPFYNDSQEMFVDIDNRPLGIKVTSYKENKAFLGLLVESVDKGGRSEREGLLQKGDVVVEINHYVLAQYSLSIAQEIFKDSMKSSELQLRVYPVEEREQATVASGNTTVDSRHMLSKHRHTPSIPVLCLVEATPPNSNRISAAKSLPDLNASLTEKLDQDASPSGKLPLAARMSLDTLANNTRKIGNMLEIGLRKGELGLGFSITTRDTPVGDPGPIYIKHILPKGAAIQDGRLHAGDRLLRVNDIEMTGHTQESAVNILRRIEVGSTVHLIVSRHVQMMPRKMKDDPATDRVLNDDNNKEYFKFEIALNDTGSAGLGISLKGNQSKKTKKDLGIFVKSVFHGGAAYQDGRLQPNDQLVSVNGQTLAGMTNHEAIDTLRTSMSTVGNVRGMIQMVIARRKNPPSGDPMSPQFSSEASSEISDSLVNERHSRTSLEITGNSKEDYSEDSFRNNADIPQQTDPSPTQGYEETYYGQHNEHHNEDWTPSPDAEDSNSDPFSRDSIFRQSISEKRKGASSRDAQGTDTFKALKSKPVGSEIVEKKPSFNDSKQSAQSSSPLKWVKPTGAKANHSSNSTLSATTQKSSTQRSPIAAKRNLNNSSNLPARVKEKDTLSTEVEVGPTLGIAKSSSLESLQTAVENYMDLQEGPLKAQPRVLRGRVLNESFRAALDQSYDLDNFSTKPMATLREEGNSQNGISPLAKSSRTHEKKRAGKSYKIFGIFRVGKSKRSLSSDRNLDSLSSTSSSPRIPESEVHKKLLEAKREDDFRKHQEETERIQAKAKAMREQQELKKKTDEVHQSRENLTRPEDRVRAPSVPVTAMQRMNIDPKVTYSEMSSGRRSVDPIAMRSVQPSTFEWQTAKRPTSPVNYGDRRRENRPEKKPNSNKSKTTPDYSSLPRQPRLEPNARALQDNPDRAVAELGNNVSPAASPNHPSLTQSRNSGSLGASFNNQEFYNMQKPPGSKKSLPDDKSHSRTYEREKKSGPSQRQNRSEKPKAGRTLYYDDTDGSPSSSVRSKTPQPRTRREVSPKARGRPMSTFNGFGFPASGNSFHREASPEPPPVTLRGSRQTTLTPSSTNYRHSVHVDAPASRRNQLYQRQHNSRPRSQKQNEPASYRWKAHDQRNNHDFSDSEDSYRTTSPASSNTAEQNRTAVKKILHQTKYADRNGAENIVMSPPYNL